MTLLLVLGWLVAGVGVALLVGVLRHGPRCRCQRLVLLLALYPLLQAKACAVAVPRHGEYGTWSADAWIEYSPGGFCRSDPFGTGGGTFKGLQWFGTPAWLNGEPFGRSAADMWLYSPYGSHQGELVARYQPGLAPIPGVTNGFPAFHTLQLNTRRVYFTDAHQPGKWFFWHLEPAANGFGYGFTSGWISATTQCINARPATLYCPGSPSARDSTWAPFYCYAPDRVGDMSACRRFLTLSSGRDGGTGCCAQVRAGENPAEQCGVYPFGDPY